MIYYCTLGVGLAVAAAFLFSRSKGASVKNLFFKMASSLFFILTAVCAVILNPDAVIFGVLLIMGGVLGLCGDAALDLKFIYKKDSHQYLNAGFIFFLIGHVFYSGAVIWLNQLKLWWVLVSAAISIVVGAATVLSGKLMKLDYGKYKLIVFLYCSFLTLTTVLSIWAAVFTKEKSMIIMSAGAVLFLLSDLVLSNTYFGKGWDKPVHIFINHFLYYAGQFLIASSIMFIN